MRSPANRPSEPRALTPAGAAGAQPAVVALYSLTWTLGALALFCTGHRLWPVDASAADPPALEAAAEPSAAPPAAHVAQPPHAEREMARLCRALEERPEATGREALTRVVREQHLTLDWRCYLDGPRAEGGWRCRTRPDGGAQFDLVLPARIDGPFWGRQPWISFRDLRRAITRDATAELRVGEGCALELVVHDPRTVTRLSR